MSYRTALAAFAIFVACGPALAQSDKGPSSEKPPGLPVQTQTAQDRDACAADVAKLCSEIVNPRPGDNRVLTCLIKHEKKLAEACRKNVDLHRKVLNQQ